MLAGKACQSLFSIYQEPLTDGLIIKIQNNADCLAHSWSLFAASYLIFHLFHFAPCPADNCMSYKACMIDADSSSAKTCDMNADVCPVKYAQSAVMLT